MSATTNTRIQFKRDISKNWNKAIGFIPLAGEVIVYTDYKQIEKEIDGELTSIFIPGVKVGDGKTYVQDLPFVDTELRDTIMNHINSQDIHVSLQEKLFWNNKLNVDDDSEVVEAALVFNRN